MKKGLTILTLVSALFLGNTEANAQTGLSRANKDYNQFAYFEAIQVYENVADKGFVDAQMLKYIGNSYYFNGEYSSANKWYSRLFNEFSTENIESEYLYRYAETLKNVGDDLNADKYFKKFASTTPSSTRAKLINSDFDSKLEIQKNSNRYDLRELNINSPYSDYANSINGNNLVFTSARDTGNFTKREFTWTGDSFTKIYESQIQSDGTLGIPQAVKGDVNYIFNQSTSVITKDGKTMYFTRNNSDKKGRNINSSGVTNLKIYQAEMINGKWKNVKEVSFNGDDFNTAHPALNRAEDELYFVSDRPGGFGNSDLWKVKITSTGFSKPINLGAIINTDGRETFPFISSNNELYFATDARQGLGGLDIYVSKINDAGGLSQVQNIGAPVNSSSDDFGYVINSQTQKGFFSSNREGGVGKDDIYGFTETRALELDCSQNLKILVVDSKTRELITDAKLTLFSIEYVPLANTNIPKDGKYTFNRSYECGDTYRVKVMADNYVTKEEVIKIDGDKETTTKAFALDRKQIEIKKNDDLFKVLNLNPIYFDYDKDNIRPDAAIELAKIVEVMKQQPKMKIDVRSFTDSRGNDAYNMKLSERRAKSTAEWIVSNGIEASRVSYKGYGESLLLNDCKNGVKCTEEEHAINRRSEFIVTEL